VGIPTSCPHARVIVVKAQECMIPQCSSGMQRVDDHIHCCWRGQGWSVTRQTCVGIPQCPSSFEPEGEGCVSQDKDSDGIPNALDKCPTEPEEMNGFEDADGCPDEPRRAAGEQDTARVAADAARLEASRREAAAAHQRAVQQAAKRRAQQAERAEQDRQSSAHTRRTVGIVLTAGGLAAGVGSFVFMGLGAAENSSIKNGGFATSGDITSAASSGSTDNTAAIALGVTGPRGPHEARLLVLPWHRHHRRGRVREGPGLSGPVRVRAGRQVPVRFRLHDCEEVCADANLRAGNRWRRSRSIRAGLQRRLR
jgi:hypothetical protein